jgi:hypothetical protein
MSQRNPRSLAEPRPAAHRAVAAVRYVLGRGLSGAHNKHRALWPSGFEWRLANSESGFVSLQFKHSLFATLTDRPTDSNLCSHLRCDRIVFNFGCRCWWFVTLLGVAHHQSFASSSKKRAFRCVLMYESISRVTLGGSREMMLSIGIRCASDWSFLLSSGVFGNEAHQRVFATIRHISHG